MTNAGEKRVLFVCLLVCLNLFGSWLQRLVGMAGGLHHWGLHCMVGEAQNQVQCLLHQDTERQTGRRQGQYRAKDTAVVC